MSDVFWDVATSDFALSIDCLVLLAALIVGFIPFGKYMPLIGHYVSAARVVAVFVAMLICFLVGFRVADERGEKRTLQAIVAAQRADLDTAEKSAADANQRVSEIERAASDQRKVDDEYISTLKPADSCGFEPFPGRLPNDARPAAPGPRSSAETESSDVLAGGAGAGSELPVSVVRRRWLPWQKP